VFLKTRKMCRFAILACTLLLVRSEDVLTRTTDSPSISASVDLCGTEPEIELTKSGETSTMTVTLSPLEPSSVCKLRVRAPKTHVIYMQFVETKRVVPNTSGTKHPPCVMSIFLPENPRVPVWKGDPCSDNALTDVDLLTSDFRIMWNPPEKPAFARGRQFVLTAVGQGQVCKEPGQHTCMRIGWDPMMCVADTLTCNGFPNCPKSSTTSDEDDKLCKKSFFAPTSLEQLAVELFKKWKPPELANNKWLHEKLEQQATSHPPKRTFFSWRDWKDETKPESTTTTTTTQGNAPKRPPKATDSISQVLSKYGPWGYLMLGMLICGTVLMFCGLWECCFRKQKTEVDAPMSQTQPTTVLIINPHEEPTPSPPNYDDLDQPPSYTTLFPNFKVNRDPSDTSGQSTDSCNQERNATDSRDQEQNSTNSSVQEQNGANSCDQEQNSTNSCGRGQNSANSCDQEQNSTNSCVREQNSASSGAQEQNADSCDSAQEENAQGVDET
jgi:hypothetical protein